MRNRVAIAVVLSVLLAGCSRPETERLAGTWVPTSLEMDGELAPQAALKDSRLFITGDTIVFQGGDLSARPEKQRYILNVNASPRTIDIIVTIEEPPTFKKIDEDKIEPVPGKAYTATALGIYSLEGDTLQLCMSKPGLKRRPTGFFTREGSGSTLMVFKRQ